MYGVKVFVKLAGISIKTFRVWCKVGKVKPYKIDNKGLRFYSDGQLDTIKGEIKRLESILKNRNLLEGELLTVKELAADLGVSEDCIYKWAREGHIPGTVRVNNTVKFNKYVMEQWLKECI